MMLTLIVGWLVVSVLFAALWSLVVRRSHDLDFAQDEALFTRTAGTDLYRTPSPRRTRNGMAEFRG